MGQVIGRIDEGWWITMKNMRESVHYFQSEGLEEAYQKERRLYRSMIQRHHPEGDLNTVH